jgi:hypothetical protein
MWIWLGESEIWVHNVEMFPYKFWYTALNRYAIPVIYRRYGLIQITVCYPPWLSNPEMLHCKPNFLLGTEFWNYVTSKVIMSISWNVLMTLNIVCCFRNNILQRRLCDRLCEYYHLGNCDIDWYIY